ncbi:hypothetical protein NRB20_56630 [Nocardia sp. RB20]|uniref:Uncharacterized protein n=1 Tax=Nocardia macrotermitis TaxID=2585198 RepID=A0A7K0D9V5_9NOCA|nr:hypothetical protein [Nocardia macrotermitis]
MAHTVTTDTSGTAANLSDSTVQPFHAGDRNTILNTYIDTSPDTSPSQTHAHIHNQQTDTRTAVAHHDPTAVLPTNFRRDTTPGRHPVDAQPPLARTTPNATDPAQPDAADPEIPELDQATEPREHTELDEFVAPQVTRAVTDGRSLDLTRNHPSAICLCSKSPRPGSNSP